MIAPTFYIGCGVKSREIFWTYLLHPKIGFYGMEVFCFAGEYCLCDPAYYNIVRSGADYALGKWV
jgi:hypothetical protein